MLRHLGIALASRLLCSFGKRSLPNFSCSHHCTRGMLGINEGLDLCAGPLRSSEYALIEILVDLFNIHEQNSRLFSSASDASLHTCPAMARSTSFC